MQRTIMPAIHFLENRMGPPLHQALGAGSKEVDLIRAGRDHFRQTKPPVPPPYNPPAPLAPDKGLQKPGHASGTQPGPLNGLLAMSTRNS